VRTRRPYSSAVDTDVAGAGRAERLLPFLRWARSYDRSQLAGDLRAGATVGVLLIPQGMAYAVLAGMPPISGLYAAVVSLLVYTALGTSRYSSVAPAAIDSLLIAAAVGPLADGDPARYVALTGALSLLAGAFQVTAGLLRVGVLVSFISIPVISGFTSAAALTIAASQLKDLLGLPGAGTTTFLQTVRSLASRLGDLKPLTLALGLAAIALLVLLRRWLPRAPGPLLVVVLVGAVAALPGLRGGVAVLGAVPSGLPAPGVPVVSLADLRALLTPAGAIALVSYLESISTATTFARRTRGRVDPNGELIAVGGANLAAGLFRGFSGAGGFSRGAVNFNAGARTPLSGALAAILLVVALFTITPLLAAIPKVALAAIIVVAVASLVDVRAARAIARVRRSDLAALVVTFLATLVAGPVIGLGIGVAVSVVSFLRHSTRPHLPELGRVPGTARFRNLTRYVGLGTDPAVAIVRLDAPLYFANSQIVTQVIADMVADRRELRVVVLDASSMPWVDYTGAEALVELDEAFAASGVELHLAAVRGPVADILRRLPASAHLVAPGRGHPDVLSAVGALGLESTSPLLDPGRPTEENGRPTEGPGRPAEENDHRPDAGSHTRAGEPGR